MAVLTRWVEVNPYFAYKADGITLCEDGDDVYFVTDVAGNGATIVPDPTNRPKIRMFGSRKRFYFPTGITAFFTVTLPGGRQYDDISHIIGFEPGTITTDNSFVPIFASTTTTAGAQMRYTVSTSASSGTSGGQVVVNDGTPRQGNWLGSGIYSYNGYGSIHVCNIASLRYIGGPGLRGYFNQAITESAFASAGTATGNLTAFFLGKHNTNATNLAGGYVDFWYIYDGAISQTDMIDSFVDARSDYPFFAGEDVDGVRAELDWMQPVFINITDSSGFGFTSPNNLCWHRKGFVTDVATNFPDGTPRFLILGHPGAGFGTMNKTVWDRVVQPEVPTDAARLVLYQRGSKNAIRSEGLTAAQTYAACLLCYQDFIAAFPDGYFITDNNNPSTTFNTVLAGYDTLINAGFTTFYAAPHIYDGTTGNGDWSSRAFLVRIRDNTWIGDFGDDVAGAAPNYLNVAPTPGVIPNNVRNYYVADSIHMKETTATNPGQSEYCNELFPLLSVLLVPIVYPASGGGGGQEGGALVGRRWRRRRGMG